MAADKKDPKSPATTSVAYDAMLPRWALIETLLGGTEAMRNAGTRYLPQYPGESDEDYACRLGTATLLNVTEETLEELASKPFTEEMKLEDIPAAVEELFDDIDLQGNNITVFARSWFRGGLAKAFFHVLVDMPRPNPTPDGSPRTLADDTAEGIRPYWVLIDPDNVLFAEVSVEGGREIYSHVRILECYTVRNGFAETEKKRIRVLEPGRVELWEPKPKKNANDKEEWAKVDEWETGLDVIPLVTFYTSRTGVCLGKPPLLDLAYLNVAHWQSTSDQRHCLTVSRFPILAASGASKDDGQITIGPNKVLYNEDAQGKFYYVEHQGHALAAGVTDIENLEKQMAIYGAEFLEEDPGNPTATAKAIDSADESSSLSAMAIKFEDSFSQALAFTALWLNIGPEGGKAEIVKDYEPAMADESGLTALREARKSRDISRDAYLDGLIRRGVLPEDFDKEADAELIEGEVNDALAAAVQFDMDPNADPNEGVPQPGQVPKPIVKKPAAKKVAKKTAKA